MDEDSADPREPTAVLFACNLNRVRSPMAEGLLRRFAGDRIFVDSCGLKRAPDDAEDGQGVDPLAAQVMAEIGCDVSEFRAKTFDELEDDSFDLVISLTPEAQAYYALVSPRVRWEYAFYYVVLMVFLVFMMHDTHQQLAGYGNGGDRVEQTEDSGAGQV